MKRKLVRQGAATMMISLPSKWIKENKLEKGSEVELVEEAGVLKIGTDVKIIRDFEIDITDANKHDIYPILTHAYRNGFNKLILKGKTNEIAKNVRKITNDILLGFEITELEHNKITLENISEPTEQKYDIMIKKSFQIIEETHLIISEDFKNKKFDSMEDVEDLRMQQDRFVLFCRRLLSKGKAEKKIEPNWELLTFLLHIEHSYYYMYQYAKENKVTNTDIVKLLKDLEQYYGLFKKSYFFRSGIIKYGLTGEVRGTQSDLIGFIGIKGTFDINKK